MIQQVVFILSKYKSALLNLSRRSFDGFQQASSEQFLAKYKKVFF